MLRKALTLCGKPYKSGCKCSEKEEHRAPFAPFCTRLGGNAPKKREGRRPRARNFYKVLTVLGGYAPKKSLDFEP